MVCNMMEHFPKLSLAELHRDLPRTWSSPTMSPFCADHHKYDVVEKVREIYQEKWTRGQTILGSKITDIVTVNGVRIHLEDGTWGLIRASSNKPGLVVVVESPVSEAAMVGMFRELDKTLSRFPEVGEYDQKLKIAA
jgi:phosphomannomutase/phosphoglucomutase